MKAAAFAFSRAASLEDLRDARPLAGGQSLGPMLNLRLARPERLVDLRHLLRGTKEDADGVTWGAATTHAEIEDGIAPDPTGGFLRGVARTIAYRAIRNRGTVGGSLCHADPAADWPGALALVGAEAITSGDRRIPVAQFVRSAFETALAPGDILLAIHIPRPAPGVRHARHKVVRKTGELAQAIAGVRVGAAGTRAMLGALNGAPLLFDSVNAARAAIPAQDLPPHRVAMLHACLDRAVAEAGA